MSKRERSRAGNQVPYLIASNGAAANGAAAIKFAIVSDCTGSEPA